MPDLLLELFSEEIPARMQRRAAEDLKKLVTDGLVEAGLVYEGAWASATPRRLVLHVTGVPPRSPDRVEERRGPRVGAPDKAVEGFLRSAGLASVAEAAVASDPKKGDFYLARLETPGRATTEIVAELVPDVVRRFPWPKAMRWGAASAGPGALRWVRPLHSIVCTFGPETEEVEVVRFSLDEVAVGDVTRGHRFMAPEPFRVRRMDDYAKKLAEAKVVLDLDRRMDIIAHDARNRALALGLELVEDPGLLEEVAGLVEWPVVLVGRFDEAFLALPDEVIRLTIRDNQKCFALREPAQEARSAEGATGAREGKLTNAFVLTANIEAPDGGRAIVAGNERVVRARLADARFFYETDLKTKLEDHAKKLAGVTFHEKLGTQAERVERIARLARELAPVVGADPDEAERAARLSKADLVTGMVGEFPELQGYIGRRYAEAQGEKAEIAAAIEEHYRPLGPSDAVPAAPVSIAVALADKLDMLVGFWAIGEKPTGSKDPYALRRAALGVVRITLQRRLSYGLSEYLHRAIEAFLIPSIEVYDFLMGAAYHKEMAREGFHGFLSRKGSPQVRAFYQRLEELLSDVDVPDDYRLSASDEELPRWFDVYSDFVEYTEPMRSKYTEKWEDAEYLERKEWHDRALHLLRGHLRPLTLDLLSFLADRLKVQLREEGARHDLVDAVFALGDQDDLLLVVRRVEALGRFLDTEDGAHLLAGYRRAANILRIEEKRDSRAYDAPPDPALLAEPAEKDLHARIGEAREAAAAAVAREDFEAAMAALSRLRAPVDRFFDEILVNTDEPALRENRLCLLAEIREATRAVADFSQIAG